MRHDQTDPGVTPTMPRPVAAEPDRAPLPRRERAGSPGPEAIDPGNSWQEIKSRFVDDPAGALAAAEELVRRAVDQRIQTLQDEARALCASSGDGEASTEDQRTRLIRYQAYCSRLNG